MESVWDFRFVNKLILYNKFSPGEIISESANLFERTSFVPRKPT